MNEEWEMDVFEAITVRRSIRKFKGEPITEVQLAKILEAGRLAPSAGNKQPWRFVVVQEENRKAQLAKAANNQSFLKDAGAIVVAVADPHVSAKWHERDTMIALEHMVLSATALGYGTCWIGAFDEDEVKRLLKIPEAMAIIALLPIGVPDEKPKSRPRKDFHEIFYKEEWQTPLTLRNHHPQLNE
jgi:nitroreductase